VKQKTRIGIAIGTIILIALVVLGVELWRRSRSTALAPGSVPIYVNGDLAAAFTPDDLDRLEQARFVDDEEGKTQEGWLLRDVLQLYLSAETLQPETEITVISTSRDKSAQLTWREVEDPEAMVLLDLSGRGTLKLVSKLERLDTRDEWVQDVDRIEVD
jgi:hypothetical protein